MFDNDKKYLEFVENLKEGIWIIDAEARTAFVNKRMAKLLGYTAEEMISMHLFNFMDDAEVEEAKKYLKRRSQSVHETHTFKFTRKNGKKIFTKVNTYPMFDKDGKFNGAIAAVTDITLLKKQHQKLEKTEALFKGVLENSSSAISIWDRELKNIYINPNAFELFGRNRKSIPQNRLIREGGPNFPHIYEKWEKRVLECFSSGKSMQYADNDQFESRTVLSESYTTPIRDSNGNIFAVAAVIEDKTEQKNLENEIHKKEKFMALGQMAAHISHEIRSPLASVSMNLELLEGELILTKKQKKSFSLINTELDRLGNLLKEILRFSTDFKLNKTRFDIKKISDNIYKLLKPLLTKKTIKFINKVKSQIIVGDAEKIESVIINIIKNSIDAVDEKGTIELYSSIENVENFYQLFIKDSGCGISDSTKLFNPFYTTKTKGIGLGLNFAKNIIEKHGGKITLVSSKPGKTIFQILLPINETASL